LAWFVFAETLATVVTTMPLHGHSKAHYGSHAVIGMTSVNGLVIYCYPLWTMAGCHPNNGYHRRYSRIPVCFTYH